MTSPEDTNWSSEEIESDDLGHYDSESTAENARGARVSPGGAGAPAHASCSKEPIVNFFTAPPLQFARGAEHRRGSLGDTFGPYVF